MYDGEIPAHCYLEGSQAMDIPSLRTYLKSLPAAHETFYDNMSQYRRDLLAKWNVHHEQVCRMLKKAVSFRPIVDIQQFITENICDIPDKPDIEAMQQNIRDYKRHEMLAKRQEDKVDALTEISRLFREMQEKLEHLKVQRFLQVWAEKEVLIRRISQLREEKEEYIENIAFEKERYADLEKDITEKEQRRKDLFEERAGNAEYQEQTRIRMQEGQLTSEQEKLTKQLDGIALEIKREAQVLSTLCETIEGWPDSPQLKSLQKSVHTVYASCNPLVSCTADIFAALISPFEKLQKTVQAFYANLRNTAYQIGEQRAKLRGDLDQDEAALTRLNQNNKDYPKLLLTLKKQLEEYLSALQGTPVDVRILADVLEIAEGQEQWRGAVEGYLHTQKFYLLVDPEFYTEALSYYDQVKAAYEGQSYGLVDVGKLREQENLTPMSGSLAEKVQTDDDLARAYVDYLLGRVICCDHVSQLRDYRTAITADGMLYQGYVARPIPRARMDDAFIGRKAIVLRIARLREHMTVLQGEIQLWDPVQKKLDAQKNRETLFTERFVQQTTECQTDYRRRLDVIRDLANIKERLSKLDLFWVDEVGRQISRIDDELKRLRDDKETSRSTQTEDSLRLKRLEEEDIPDANKQLLDKEICLDEEFTIEYRSATGEPRYAQELERLKQPAMIAKNFGDRLQQTANEVEQAKNNLFQARNTFVRDFQPCSFRTNVMHNEEFEAERILLEESELPLYREKIQNARASALEQFQNDFLNKLMSSIKQVQDQVKNLNRALRNAQFGTDQYQFRIDRNPNYANYYDMIMAPEHLEGESGLFGLPFQQKYGQLVEDLFSRIAASDDTQFNARKQSELQQNIDLFTDFRTYLKFDLETTDQNGNRQLLSQTLNTKSGGETQTPFYIAVLASFAQLYRVNDASGFGNTVRLVVFDEAFNKMDSERIIESVRLLRKMRLQAIISTPPDKVPDIMPVADRTLYVSKDKYSMQILPYNKEIEDTWSEG